MIYIIALISSLLLTGMVRIVAMKRSLLDMPNERSSHSVPTPHGGGIAIAVTWFIFLSIMFYQDMLSADLYYALLAGGIISIVSFVDDIYDISPKVRLIAQAATAIIGLSFLGGLDSIDLGICDCRSGVLLNIVAFFALVWSINLYNFLDGIDGYAGSEAVFIGIAAFLLLGAPHYLLLSMVVLGFLIWNWQRAKIFMGDVGSTLLGYTIMIFALYEQNEGHTILVWLIIYILFWFDATYTLIYRLRLGKKVFKPHKMHWYQLMTQRGWSHQRVVLLSIVINTLILIALYILNDTLHIYILLILLFGLFLVQYLTRKNHVN